MFKMVDNKKAVSSRKKLQQRLKTLQNNYSNIPKEMQEKNRWVCHKNKIPISPHSGQAASCSDVSTWSDFETAKIAVEEYNLDGIGFQLGDGIFGIDLDNCIDENGVISDEAKDIVETMNSYTEISPSGRGLHIFAFGKIPDGARKNTKKGFEIYSEGRYFTVTANIYENYIQMCDRTNETKIIHEKYFKKEKETFATFATENWGSKNSLSENEIIEKMFNSKNGIRIKALWHGNISDYPSQSEADLALCNELAFWCCKDERLMDSLFKQSGLMRSKWNETHGKQTYGQITVQTAIAGTHNQYEPDYNHITNNKIEENKNYVDGKKTEDEEIGWGKLEPLDYIDIPPFPVDCFPLEISEFLKALSISTQKPLEMGGILMLGILAVCNQRKYEVRIKSTYSESLSLYTVAVAESGERKSATLNLMVKPINEYEKKYNIEHKDEISKNHHKHSYLEKRVEFLKKKASSSGKPEDEKKAEEVAVELGNFKKQYDLKLSVDNITIEKLAA